MWSVKKENEEARASLSWKKTHIFIMELKKRGVSIPVFTSPGYFIAPMSLRATKEISAATNARAY